jgi:hypothetical protein
MGKVLGAVAAGILTVATGGTFLGFTGITAGLLTAASSLVLSGLSSALSPKPKAPDVSSSPFQSIKSGSITKQIRQPITPRRTVYGELRASGPYAFIGSTNSNQYLHFILLLASHEVENIGEIWANDDSITPDMLDGNGDVTSGKYSGLMRIVKYNGTTTQGADATMQSAFPEWTAAHQLLGISYVYVRLKYDRDKFASGIPNISAWIKGKKVFDTRVDQSKWHHNPALFVNDYLVDTSLGLGVDQADIDDDFIISSANNCEEFVTTESVSHDVSSIATSTDIFTLAGDTLKFQTGDRVNVISDGSLPGGITDASTNYYVIPYQRRETCRIKLASSYANALAGTAVDISSAGSGTIQIVKNAEPRYSAGGYIDSDGEPHSIIEGILSSMAGKTIYSGGRWRILSGSYETPTIAFDEDDLAGPITLQTKTSRRDRFNRVIGTYVSPLNNGQPTDYPSVGNSTYETQDGRTIETPFDQPFTQRTHQAQRIAKIKLEISRQEIIFTSKFKLSAFKVQVGDNCLMSNATYGWTNKPFEVVEWSLQVEEIEGQVIPYIEMKLKETASTIYDWNSGEETAVDPAPNTTLPEIFNVAAPSGLSFDSYPVATLGGDTVFRIVLSWDQHEDTFVLQGGLFEIQYKLAADSEYKPSFFVDGALTLSEIVQGAAGAEYDLRMRAVNNIGVRSGWQPLTGVVSGSSGGVTDTEDWGNFTDTPTSPPADTADWEDFSGGTSGDEDWGGFIS